MHVYLDAFFPALVRFYPTSVNYDAPLATFRLIFCLLIGSHIHDLMYLINYQAIFGATPGRLIRVDLFIEIHPLGSD